MKPSDAEILDFLRAKHQGDDPVAAREALLYCAVAGVALPEWLAKIVVEAIQVNDRGKADDVLGFGNKAKLAVWKRAHQQGRDAAIRHIPDSVAWHKANRTGVRKGAIVEAVAKAHLISPKAVEKILYAPDSPTRRSKK